MASSSSYNSPCAACKFLRRKCMPGCIFAPYFPPEEPQKFANVHKIFGASNVTKLLNELLPHQREDAVNSLAYEAEARVRDPVYGCVGAISFLQRQVQRLQKELDAANADLLRYSFADIAPTPMPPGLTNNATSIQQIPQRFGARFGNEGNGFYNNNRQYSPNLYSYPYSLPWTDTSSEDISNGGGIGGGAGGGVFIIVIFFNSRETVEPLAISKYISSIKKDISEIGTQFQTVDTVEAS
ncbi:hypothetical protein PIB30_078611 [Stylosanthes scabra]|uniref:LOB domain-containing protein n=1 Tax=Stylosanthes scabra TaxID=79078 RepID=A0ABU6YSR2_9FABA|nr:hypothetical protein [Stylosanthes scabra]